ncbi:MAG TPA: aminoacyl-tRNA hydrolase [Rhodocyclaceae bacterium]|nr:MAG: aminoacyl-tRNA hydrolase [Rhodocyclales bacterium CG_4_9_14_3_um_filter_68_10]HCX34890.1 aminoacyl-tRNA hydrolase [Rhodocyclaceae bacterium]
MIAPRLVVGLGNPGAQYAETRHNCGAWLAERLGAALALTFRREARFHALAAHLRSPDLWLLLPQTYMNCSGRAAGAALRFFRIPPEALLVLHDDLDLEPGALRLKFGGGAGGHNGLKDIVAHLGTPDFWRLRIGIGHPGNRDEVIDYVLEAPRAQEREAINDALDRAMAAWPQIAAGQWPAAMQKLNVRGKAADASDAQGKGS